LLYFSLHFSTAFISNSICRPLARRFCVVDKIRSRRPPNPGWAPINTRPTAISTFHSSFRQPRLLLLWRLSLTKSRPICVTSSRNSQSFLSQQLLNISPIPTSTSPQKDIPTAPSQSPVHDVSGTKMPPVAVVLS